MFVYACVSMTPASRHSVSSPVPLDLNEDQNHEPFTPNHPLSSFSSLSYPRLFNPPDQDQDWEPKHLPINEKAEKIIPSSGSSWDHSAAAKMHENCSGLKLSMLKKEEIKDENLEAGVEDGSSVKWMPSKMRMMRKMMVSDQTASSYIAGNSIHNFEDQQQPLLSPLGTENNTNSSNNYSNHGNITVRVCSDCHTTKTPLWRSGPRGPKSLCNACGIRQRKARRAAAMAAASANGTILVAAEASMKGNKLGNKEKKSKIECAPQLKKKRKLGVGSKRSQVRNKKLGVKDLTLRLSKNLALQQVFPQDEIKEAAILLMALSYGLVHG